MAGVPSIVDIMKLSQAAWRIGRAFSPGRRGAPAEFLEVEAQASNLCAALKILAEMLFSDDNSLLLRADEETRLGVTRIFESCQKTLTDLESFVDQYQVIRRQRTSGGYTVERSWSDLVLSTYRTMSWTTEGGNIRSLMDLLHMHASTINLTLQALQSKSLGELQRIVSPMAEKIDDIHSEINGNLSEKIESIHQIVVAIAGGTPNLPARDESPGTISPQPIEYQNPQPFRDPGRRFSLHPTSPPLPHRPPELVDYLPSASPHSRRMSCPTPPNPVDEGYEEGQYEPQGLSLSSSPTLSGASTRKQSVHSRKQSTNSCKLPTIQQESAIVDSDNHTYATEVFSQPAKPLPPPALPLGNDPIVVGDCTEFRSVSEDPEPPSPTATVNQQTDFEREMARSSAILCEARGTLVDYMQVVEGKYRQPEEMVEAAGPCRILLVRKRNALRDGSVRLTSSVWVLSDDRSVRMQQKLVESVEITPYSSYLSPGKISVTVPTELRFHDKTYGTRPLRIVNTRWINYVFEDVSDARNFQSAIFGRTLLASFRTTKTMRVHDGITSVLTYQEQMCGMENLRLFRDEEGPSTYGGVLALIHFSAHFRPGYLAFWLNSSAAPVRVKDEGGRMVKVKGFKVPIGGGSVAGGSSSTAGASNGANGEATNKGAKTEQKKDPSTSPSLGAGSLGRRGSEARRYITGARIEFPTEKEKLDFLARVKELQRTMIELPDL